MRERILAPVTTGRRLELKGKIDARILSGGEMDMPGIEYLSVFENGRETSLIPIYDCRNNSHHELIAKEFGRRHVGVAFGDGLYGLTAGIDDPRSSRPDAGSDQVFFDAKSGRTRIDRIPAFISPRNLLDFLDLSKVHPRFRKLFESRENREFIWETGMALHVIGPIKEQNPGIHDIFVTTPELWKDKTEDQSQWQSMPTAPFFYWHDPDWEHIGQRIESFIPDSIVGISSFNEHKEAPAWTKEDIADFVENKRIVPFDFIVQDPIGEAVGVRSSFGQIAVPLVGEDPVWKIYRYGPTDLIDFFAKVNERFGEDFGYEIVDDVKIAARGYSIDEAVRADKQGLLRGLHNGFSLDEQMREVHARVRDDYDRRHPRLLSTVPLLHRRSKTAA